MSVQRVSAIMVFYLLLSYVGFAQDAAQKAQVEVSVVDAKNLPRDGQVVVFNGKQNQLSGQTNKLGKLSIQLPTGDDYAVGIKDVTETNQQSTLSIPALKAGESLTGAYKVNIVYEPARTITLSNVQFDVSKATLKPTSYQQLNELLDYMRMNKNEKIEIGGHTDSSGVEEKNVILSQQRADTIKEYLVKNGVPADKVVARGYGSSQPISDNQTPEGKAKNRRTEVKRIVE